MPIIFDLTDVEPANVTVRVSEMAEMMAMLHCIAEPGHHLELSRELKAIDAEISAQLRRTMRSFSPLWARFRFRALMPLNSRASQGFDSELASVAALPLEAFVQMSVQAIIGGRSDRTLDIMNDSSDRADFIEICRTRSEEREELGARLARDPELFRQVLTAFLRTFHDTCFHSRWESGSARLKASEVEVQRRLAGGSASMVLASLTPGAHFFPQTSQVAYDKLQNAFVNGSGRKFVLVPSNLTKPHVVVKYDDEYAGYEIPIIVQFPISDMGTVNRSIHEIQNQMAVLADSARLELCRHLVNEYCTTSDLSRRLGIGAPQVSRHLRKLREAELLESIRDGKMVKHRLRMNVVYSIGYEFLTRIVK
ncbi:DUF5937 family protein [Paeniglutamicibacter sulfureus]|nr:DUF5937 family protein [Paeniglutamicibacter sulfureus]MDO2934723.1 DUF5937 family protein [Paeniglutamicibacter sulfureus]